ncbi:MAG: beta-ketoacyl-[acyl-carrier-protein] synthase family protein [Candidatus Brocadiaceae bacterium]|nr:beta-ketoacyl-[acyl-carrier-protein] synthase family protein [Candidatus Brocadiaceae bacterium]
MMKRRVVITGLGILAPNGIGKEAYWDAIINGRSGINRISSFDPSSFTTQIAGEVENFDPKDYVDSRMVARCGRFTHFGIAASRMATADAGIDFSKENKERCGVCFGTTLGPNNDVYETQHRKFISSGPLSVGRLTPVEITPHVTTGYICSDLHIAGPNSTLTSGCSTGLDVMGWGHKMIQQGKIDVAVIGCADTPIFPFILSALCNLGILSRSNKEPEKASRPYDKRRDGMVLSEGGVSIVLEELHHALDRGADIYAEVLSFASTCDAQDIVNADTGGQALISAMEEVLVSGRVGKEEIDYICAHGNSMPSYDIAETNAFKAFFGERSYRIPVSSIKSMTGQSFAAGGGFQVVATSLSLKNGFVPPTINLDEPDPLCDLDYVPHEARRFSMETALINSHSVGNTHAALVLRRFSGEGR